MKTAQQTIQPQQKQISLTGIMTGIQKELGEIEINLLKVQEGLKNNYTSIVQEAMKNQQVSPEKQKEYQEEIENTLEKEVFDKIDEARNLSVRFLRITENATTIARNLDPWQSFKADIYESDWYRKKFPLDYEKRKRMEELKQRRYVPEKEYRGRETSPDDEYIEQSRRRRKQRSEITHFLSKTAGMEDIIKDIKIVQGQIQTFQKQYFSSQSPVPESAAKVYDAVSKKVQKMKEPGLGSQVNIVNEVFGNPQNPGKYLISGVRAFLAPMSNLLNDASDILNKILSNSKQMGQSPEELIKEKEMEKPISGEELQSWESKSQQTAPQAPLQTPPTPGQSLKTQTIQKLRQRIGTLNKQKKRCDLVQRLVQKHRGGVNTNE